MIKAAVAAGALLVLAAAVRAGAPDSVHGEQVYARCVACHALAADRVGPHLAGSVPGFPYSPAMKASGIT